MTAYLILVGFLTFIFWISRYIHGFFHELGHLVFGLICGWRFLAFRLFSLLLIKEQGQLKLRRFYSPVSFVYCDMAPSKKSAERYPILLPLLGSALMNLLAGIGFFFLGLNCSIPLLDTSAYALAATGLQFALLDAIPYRNSVYQSDASKAMDIRRTADNRRVYWLLRTINAEVQRGNRMKDMPDEWFPIPSDAQMKDPMFAELSLNLCSRLMEQQSFRQAHGLISHFLSIDSAITPHQRGFFTCDLIFLELIGENRPTFLQSLRTPEQLRFMDQLPDYLTVLRTRYAYALLHEGSAEQATQYKARLLEKVKNAPCPWDAASELDLLAAADAASYRINL
jgi:hypothetical protein